MCSFAFVGCINIFDHNTFVTTVYSRLIKLYKAFIAFISTQVYLFPFTRCNVL